MSSRPVLRGFIKFNLVTIPVGGYTATRGQGGIAMNQLHKGCGQYKKTCPVHTAARGDGRGDVVRLLTQRLVKLCWTEQYILEDVMIASDV